MSWWDDLRRKVGSPSLNPAYPSTFIDPPERYGTRRAEIFDPALKHYAAAFRRGDPDFDDPQVEAAWRAARRIAMDYALTTVAAHPLGASLTLRGSRVMRAWYGDAAREPGDLDWVAPAEWRFEGPEAADLRRDLTKRFAGPARVVREGIEFVGAVLHTKLWTYERAPGYRLVIPWTALGVPDGEVQMDFVFEEPMPDAPVRVALATEPPGSRPVTVSCATPALSLAWKLIWLLSDSYPQGKDLYDAALLAESTAIPEALLDFVVAGLSTHQCQAVASHAPRVEQVVSLLNPASIEGTIDWDNFRLEMGRRGEQLGPVDVWLARLVHALIAGPGVQGGRAR